jgi:hypothetical protein
MNTPKQFLRYISNTEECAIVTLDQPLVDWLLSINTSNRKVKPSVVHAYAEEIRRGEWLVTSQGIGISRNGILVSDESEVLLLDGQHRLLALRECGYPPTRSVLVWGLSKEAQLKVDTHSKRSMANILSLAIGVFTDNTRAAALRILAILMNGGTRLDVKVPISDAIECYGEIHDAWNSVSFSTKAPGVSGGFIAPCVYAVACGVPSEIVQSFITGYATGVDLQKGSPILRLRDTYGKGFNTGARGQVVWFCRTARALAAFVNGETIDKLYTPEAKDAIALLRNLGKARVAKTA